MTRYVIKKAEVEAMTGLAKTHFLNPDAQRSNRSLGDVTGLTGLGFHIVEVAPGKASTEYHVHHYEDECVYILAGRAEVDINGERTTVEPGDFIGYRAEGGHTPCATPPARCCAASSSACASRTTSAITRVSASASTAMPDRPGIWWTCRPSAIRTGGRKV